MTERVVELHGIPLADLLAYLTRLGGMPEPSEAGQPVTVLGPGWQAQLTPMPDYHLGQAAFCSVQATMQGEDEAVKTVWRRFELSVLRPGG